MINPVTVQELVSKIVLMGSMKETEESWGSKVKQYYMAAQFSASSRGEGEERDQAGREGPGT